MEAIDNSENILDSRDVIERIAELEALGDDRDETETEELQALKDFAEEADGYATDWIYGDTLVRDSFFTEYAQQLAENVGAIDDNAHWPATCIDWEWAARELQMDYTAIDFDGVTYWVR